MPSKFQIGFMVNEHVEMFKAVVVVNVDFSIVVNIDYSGSICNHVNHQMIVFLVCSVLPYIPQTKYAIGRIASFR